MNKIILSRQLLFLYSIYLFVLFISISHSIHAAIAISDLKIDIPKFSKNKSFLDKNNKEIQVDQEGYIVKDIEEKDKDGKIIKNKQRITVAVTDDNNKQKQMEVLLTPPIEESTRTVDGIEIRVTGQEENWKNFLNKQGALMEPYRSVLSYQSQPEVDFICDQIDYRIKELKGSVTQSDTLSSKEKEKIAKNLVVKVGNLLVKPEQLDDVYKTFDAENCKKNVAPIHVCNMHCLKIGQQKGELDSAKLQCTCKDDSAQLTTLINNAQKSISDITNQILNALKIEKNKK